MKTILFVTAVLLGGAQQTLSCCYFNGNTYAVNETIPDVCIEIICSDVVCPITGVRHGSEWVVQTGTPIECDCANCEVYNDPHFIPFDNTVYDDYYNYHGRCRHALAEYVEDLGPNPSSAPYIKHGTYADFRACGTASCVDIFSYQVGAFADTLVHVKYTAVDLIYNNMFVQPGSPFPDSQTPFFEVLPGSVHNVVIDGAPHNLLAWMDGSCSRMLGPDFLAEVCPWSINLWTTEAHKTFLGGLCGKYDGDAENVLTHGDDGGPTVFVPELYATDFGFSWKTDFQYDNGCLTQLQSHEEARKAKETLAKCNLKDASLKCEKPLSKCTFKSSRRQSYRNSCIEDICMDSREEAHWLNNTAMLCENQVKIQGETKTCRVKQQFGKY